MALAEPSQRERKRVRRRGVEPLEVVNGDEDGLVFGEQLQCTSSRNPERARIDRIRGRLFDEERGLKRATPRRW